MDVLLQYEAIINL